MSYPAYQWQREEPPSDPFLHKVAQVIQQPGILRVAEQELNLDDDEYKQLVAIVAKITPNILGFVDFKRLDNIEELITRVKHIPYHSVSPDRYFKRVEKIIEKHPRDIYDVNKEMPKYLHVVRRAIQLDGHCLDVLDFNKPSHAAIAFEAVSKRGDLISIIDAHREDSEILENTFEDFLEVAVENDKSAGIFARDCPERIIESVKCNPGLLTRVEDIELQRSLAPAAIEAQPILLRYLDASLYPPEEYTRLVRIAGHVELGVKHGRILDSEYEEIICDALRKNAVPIEEIRFDIFPLDAHKELIKSSLRHLGHAIVTLDRLVDDDLYFEFADAAAENCTVNDINWDRLSSYKSRRCILELAERIASNPPYGIWPTQIGPLTADEMKRLMRKLPLAAINADIFTDEEYDELVRMREGIRLCDVDHARCSPKTYIDVAWTALENDSNVLNFVRLPPVTPEIYGEMAKAAVKSNPACITRVCYPPCPTNVYRALLSHCIAQ